jgi:hypothetical protein
VTTRAIIDEVATLAELQGATRRDGSLQTFYGAALQNADVICTPALRTA